MYIKQSCYDSLLSQYTNREGALGLLKQHRPYLEMLPSMRRPFESVLSIPLPIAKVRTSCGTSSPNFKTTSTLEAIALPCDLAILMCDPEWKIKMGVEIMVFIHRPEEDFSQLLTRWRQTQILLHQDYEWVMPLTHQHMFSEMAENIYPLFVLFPETPERIIRGLDGASLPFVVENIDHPEAELIPSPF